MREYEPMPLLALFMIVALSDCICPLSEMPESEYATLAAAQAADAVGAQGWIPAILPKDAGAIREVHDIDTNRAWGCFTTTEPEAVRAFLLKLDAHRIQGAIGPEPHAWFRDFSWWPESMRTGAAEAWQFREARAAPEGSPIVVRVGMDSKLGRICFHRIQQES